MNDFDNFHDFVLKRLNLVKLQLKSANTVTITHEEVRNFALDLFDYFILNHGIYSNYNKKLLDRIREKYGLRETKNQA